MIDRHTDFASNAGKSRLELDELIAQFQCARRIKTDVQDNFTILDVFAGYMDRVIDRNGDIGRKPIVCAPFVERTNQVRSSRRRVPSIHGVSRATLYIDRLFAHHFFGRCQRFDIRCPGKDPLRIFQQRGRILAQLDAVKVQPPQQWRNGNVKHREIVAQHELVFQEDRRQLSQALPNMHACLLKRFLVSLGSA